MHAELIQLFHAYLGTMAESDNVLELISEIERLVSDPARPGQ